MASRISGASWIVLLLLIAACGEPGEGLVVTDARLGMPTGPNAALYFTVENHADGADVLESVATEVATSVEVHETVAGDDGTMGMRPVDAPLEVPADGSLMFEPGGFHLMLVDVERLDVGDEIEVTLTWQNAGEMTIDAMVVEPQDVSEHEAGDG